ncbi:MAG: transcriptional regulator domain-containing protein, partial [Giesbergeria sp.]
MAELSSDHWHPSAAYLYVLHLDCLALAWEYLRRDPDYQRDWLRRQRHPEQAQRWGLRLTPWISQVHNYI